MYLKSLSLDDLVKRVNHNFQADNTDIEGDYDDYYSSDEDECEDELPIWMKLHETFIYSYLQFIYS